MEVKLESNKVRVLVSLFSLLRLRGRSSYTTMDNNLELMDTIKANFNKIDKKLLEFLYCYLFMYMEELMNGKIVLDPKKQTVTIDKSTKEAIGTRYQKEVISMTKDEKLPIKRKTTTVFVPTNGSAATISSTTTLMSEEAIEMVDLSSDPLQLPMNEYTFKEAFDLAGTLPLNTIRYRTKRNLSMAHEIRRKEKSYYVEKLYLDGKDVSRMKKLKNADTDIERQEQYYQRYQNNFKNKKYPFLMADSLEVIQKNRHLMTDRITPPEVRDVEPELAEMLIRMDEETNSLDSLFTEDNPTKNK